MVQQVGQGLPPLEAYPVQSADGTQSYVAIPQHLFQRHLEALQARRLLCWVPVALHHACTCSSVASHQHCFRAAALSVWCQAPATALFGPREPSLRGATQHGAACQAKSERLSSLLTWHSTRPTCCALQAQAVAKQGAGGGQEGPLSMVLQNGGGVSLPPQAAEEVHQEAVLPKTEDLPVAVPEQGAM